MSVSHRTLGMKYLEECTESELNRLTDKMLDSIKRRGVILLLLAIGTVFFVYQLNNGIALTVQAVLTGLIIFIWFSSTKEVVEFETILLKKKVNRVGRARAVARLTKKSD